MAEREPDRDEPEDEPEHSASDTDGSERSADPERAARAWAARLWPR